jgi:hypothetical protein
MRIKKKLSLTLIELLIATSIFSVIILSIYSAFQMGILSYRRIDSAFQVYQMARITLNRMELDLKNSFAYAKEDSKFKGSDKAIDFFSLIDSYSRGGESLGLFRIKYEWAIDALKRSCYKGEDALKKDTEAEAQESSFDIKDISFKFAYHTEDPDRPYDWQTVWPKDNSQKNTLPLAIKIKLSLIEKDSRQKQPEKVIEFDKTIYLPLS